jgi:hypothetical protein
MRLVASRGLWFDHTANSVGFVASEMSMSDASLMSFYYRANATNSSVYPQLMPQAKCGHIIKELWLCPHQE